MSKHRTPYIDATIELAAAVAAVRTFPNRLLGARAIHYEALAQLLGEKHGLSERDRARLVDAAKILATRKAKR